jgi:hypothetical protein
MGQHLLFAKTTKAGGLGSSQQEFDAKFPWPHASDSLGPNASFRDEGLKPSGQSIGLGLIIALRSFPVISLGTHDADPSGQTFP